MTREEWLQSAVELLKPVFKEKTGLSLPRVRVSVGWPSRGGTGAGSRVIGQCWNTCAAADGVPQIFISPVLGDSIKVLETLVHELVHALDDCESGHRGAFRRIALNVGLEGKMTATHAGGPLWSDLVLIRGYLGSYPHSPLSVSAATKTQTTRMLKIQCMEWHEDDPDLDGYSVRTTAKWLDRGFPLCPCGARMDLA